MTDRQIMDGYAIIPPVSHRYEEHRRQIELDNVYSRIGKTPSEAWRRHVQTNGVHLNDGEFATRVQHWHDQGYRLVKVTLEIHQGDDND